MRESHKRNGRCKMTELKQYEKGYSPSALQIKYSLPYEQGYELAQDFKRLQEQLKEANDIIKQYAEKTMMGYPKNDGTYVLQNGTIIDEKKVVISTTILDPRPANDYLKKWGVK